MTIRTVVVTSVGAGEAATGPSPFTAEANNPPEAYADDAKSRGELDSRQSGRQRHQDVDLALQASRAVLNGVGDGSFENLARSRRRYRYSRGSHASRFRPF
jgi:hypothetical protein